MGTLARVYVEYGPVQMECGKAVKRRRWAGGANRAEFGPERCSRCL